jgi:hypothetical protein
LHPNVVLPALTSLVGFAFCGVLFRRFVQRPRAYLFVWGLGLLWYAIAAATEALGGAFGWSSVLYRTWYLTGAIGVAAYLGAGSVYLHRDEPGFRSLSVVCIMLASAPALAGGYLMVGFFGLSAAVLCTVILSTRPGWFAHAVFGALVVATVLAASVVAQSTIDRSLLPTMPDQVVSGQAFPAGTRALTPPLNISGAVLLLFGALASVIHFGRTRAQPDRVLSNVLIAVGALVPSLASGLTRFGITSLFFLGELLGLLCILAGFLLSASTRARPSPSPPG